MKIGANEKSYLHKIRMYELQKIIPFLPDGASILEIGAGVGWQAKALSNRGYSVEAIDLSTSRYASGRVWPVVDYDGEHIPFPNAQFDIVLSSNVLEHVKHVEAFQSEILRVLKPEGTAIHILPTFSWRFWAIISFYLSIIERRIHKHLVRDRMPAANMNGSEKPVQAGGATEGNSIVRKLIPSRHGEVGNWFTELYLFSRFRWLPLFRRAGWDTRRPIPTGLCYIVLLNKYALPGIRMAHIWSYVLGSSCLIYIMKQHNLEKL